MSADAAAPDPRAEPLARWLERRLDATTVDVVGFATPKSGFSGETTMVDVRVSAGGTARDERFVLRVETPEPAVYPVQAPGLDIEIEIQFRVMDALARHGSVPIAPLVGFERDPGVLGTPFFVMGFVGGEVPIESPPYTVDGLFTAAAPEHRRTMIFEGLRALAGVHRLDWRAAGLDWLVPPGVEPTVARQLDVWEAYARRELGERSHPLLERTFAWLHAHVPPTAAPGLCWGDPRPGNIIFRDHRPVCLTDFEAASIAPPEHDLGWWLMFDRTMHEGAGLTERPPGDPTRDEQQAFYAECAGRDPGDMRWHEVFAGARYSAIVVRVMNRLAERGLLPPDSEVWRDNPASACLAQMLDE